MAVEHERRPASRARPGAEHVGAAVLDLLPLDVQAEVAEHVAHELGHRLLGAGEARHRDGPHRELGEPPVVDLEAHLAMSLPAMSRGPSRGPPF